MNLLPDDSVGSGYRLAHMHPYIDADPYIAADPYTILLLAFSFYELDLSTRRRAGLCVNGLTRHVPPPGKRNRNLSATCPSIVCMHL